MLSSNVITLRPYQSEMIQNTIRILKRDNIAAVASAVGSGKTLMCKCIIHKLNFKKVIIATPFLNIGKDFETNSNTRYIHGASFGAGGSYFIRSGRFEFVEERSMSTIKNVIQGSVRCKPHIITHHTLARLENFFRNLKNKDLSDTLIVIDEAHHCSDNEMDNTKIGHVIAKARKNGASILYMTATPYRINNDKPFSILPKDCVPCVRTVGEQILGGYSPRVRVKYVKIKQGTLVDNGRQTISCNGNSHFSGNRAVDDCKEIVFNTWRGYGFPKSILIIPPGDSERVSKRMVDFFEGKDFSGIVSKRRGKKNPKVLNAVGMNKDEIISHIQMDKLNNGKEYDLVIACKRCDEGTDIPSASHIFSIGIPGNIRLINQRMGRILRNKKELEDYKNFFGNFDKESVVTYFLPPYTKVKDFNKQAGNQLLHCVLVGEAYEKYCNDIPFAERIKVQIKNNMKKGKKKDKSIEIIDKFINESEHEKTFVWKGVLVEAFKKGKISVAELPRILERLNEDVGDGTSTLLNLMDLVEMEDKDKKKVVDKAYKKIVKLPPSDKVFVEAIKEVFDEVVEKFNKKLLKVNSSKKINELSYMLTGKDMKQWCEQFFEDFEARMMAWLEDEEFHEMAGDLV